MALSCVYPFVNPPSCDVCTAGFIQNQTTCLKCNGTIEALNDTDTFLSVGTESGPVTNTDPYVGVNASCGCWGGNLSTVLSFNASFVTGLVVQPTSTAWVQTLTLEASADRLTWSPVGNLWTLDSPIDATSHITTVSTTPQVLTLPWVPLARFMRVGVVDYFNAHDNWPVLQAGLLVGTTGTRSRCVPCRVGWFCNGTYQEYCPGVVAALGCAPCPARHTCHNGSATPCTGDVVDNTCVSKCKAGYWCPSPGFSVLCPDNTTSDPEATSREQCVPDAGLWWSEGQVVPCPANSWCSLGSVVPCTAGKTTAVGAGQPSDCRCAVGWWGWDGCSPCLQGCSPGWAFTPCGPWQDGRCDPCPYVPWTEFSGAGCEFRCRGSWDGAQCQPELEPAPSLSSTAANGTVAWSGGCGTTPFTVTPRTTSVQSRCGGVVQTVDVEVATTLEFGLRQARQLHGPIPETRLVHSQWGGYAVLVRADRLAYRWQNQSWTLAQPEGRVEVGMGYGHIEVQVSVGSDLINFRMDPATATPLSNTAWWEDSVAVMRGVKGKVDVPYALYDMGVGCGNVPDAAEWLGLQLELDHPGWLHEFARRQCGDEPTWLLVPHQRTFAGACYKDGW